jgi:cell division septum initiation protein DivIVA
MSTEEPVESTEPVAGGHREISSEVHSVIAAAERAAEAIRADAEAQAHIHLSDAQERANRLTAERLQMIGELTDDLLVHASAVREQSAAMLATLERAIEVAEERLTRTPALPPAPEPDADEPDPAAVLRATQLAVAGESRASIAETLAEEFGIDAEPVLARVLGPA